MTASDRWLDAARSVLERIATSQSDAIEAASRMFAESIATDRLVHVFGSGHSRMNTEEMFPRIGSYPGFHPIAELALSNHVGVVGPNGLRQAMFLEKVPGFARVILQQFKIHAGDSLLVFSSTGINTVVIEIALYAKAMGLPVVAVTSLDHAGATVSRHESGRKLGEVADVTIDNGSPAGDASVEIHGVPYRVGPTSSIGAIAIVNALKARTAELLIERGVTPVVLTSPHFVGSAEGEVQLERVYDEYFRRVRLAYDAEGAIPVPEGVGAVRLMEVTVTAPLIATAAVVVIGSGSAGSTAAIAAARAGASVLLVEKLPFLGGTSTGVLDTFYGFYTPGSASLKVVGGIADEVVAGLRALGPVVERPNSFGAGTGVTYHPEHLKVVWERLVADAGADLLLHAFLQGATVRGGRVEQVLVATKAGLVRIGGQVFVDASGDADLCFHAGFGFELAGEPEPAQTLTTTFKVVNVDMARRKTLAKSDLDRLMTEAAEWGGYDLPRREGSDHITPVEGMTATVMTRVESFQREGDRVINATDPEFLTRAEIQGRRQALEYVRFLVDKVPGYERAAVASFSTQIGVRETRRVYGDVRLTRDDVLAARRFDDEIGLCGAPIEDHHAGSGTRWQYLPDGQVVGIPYRALLVRDAANVLVAGRCFSATHDAHASVRSMAQCMAMGQAAGTAAGLAARDGMDPRQVDPQRLRARLREDGAVLEILAASAA